MIEQFTQEELKILLKEVDEMRRENTKGTRHYILKQEALNLGMGDIFISEDIRSGIYKVCDKLTHNYTEVQTKNGIYRSMTNKVIPEDKREEYATLVRGFLEVMKPYYGMLGFCER